MPALLSPLTRTVTYTRWLHLLSGAVFVAVCSMVYPGFEGSGPVYWIELMLSPVPVLLLAAAVPGVRLAEGLQARLLLVPGQLVRHEREDLRSGIAVARAASWRDRRRTALWLVLRAEAGLAVALLSVQAPALTFSLLAAASGTAPDDELPLAPAGHHWSYALLAPLPLLVLAAVVVGGGAAMTAAARRLLGPSPAEKLAALEERTERLLEHNRLARELHDSIGHALTVSVVQAGAARAAGSPEFTDRALDAIEDTGRRALEDLERVLRLLREGGDGRAADRPKVADAGRLVESARASGAEVDVELSGPVTEVPGPVSREGYRIVQEALTNALRHAGPRVRVSVRIAYDRAALELDVRNPVPEGARTAADGGRGLCGIRERAVLLGGTAHTGPYDGGWRVHALLPAERPGP
ncbi:sensor histidine kinase [Streptomyces lycii]|uniref:histidine kinase n=1 Tax=Streptomyces lycii TaxID=2654337 RepID=A0ABQ7FNR5_9ACTN|nr:histidine kinase [Streptomyces lycii]KAF4409648.1 two-component sensor histidine kinase [Streptomyces lycii]